MTKGSLLPRRIAIVGAIVAAAIVISLGAAFVFRDPLASFFAARGMAGAGLVCDRVAVQLPASFPPSAVRLAPMRCTSATGPLASIRFAAPLDVKLDGVNARAVSCAAIDVDLRTQHRRVAMNALGDLSHVVGLDQPAVDLLLDWAELAPRDLPPFSAAHAVISRAGRRIVEMRDMHLWPESGGQSMSAAEVHVDKVAALGAATLSGHSTPGQTAMALVFGDHLHIEVTGKHLGSPQQSVDFKAGDGSGGGE